MSQIITDDEGRTIGVKFGDPEEKENVVLNESKEEYLDEQDKMMQTRAKEFIERFKQHAYGPKPMIPFPRGFEQVFVQMGLSPNFAKERNMDSDWIEEDIAQIQINMNKEHWKRTIVDLVPSYINLINKKGMPTILTNILDNPRFDQCKKCFMPTNMDRIAFYQFIGLTEGTMRFCNCLKNIPQALMELGYFSLSPHNPMGTMSIGLIQFLNIMHKEYGVPKDKLAQGYNGIIGMDDPDKKLASARLLATLDNYEKMLALVYKKTQNADKYKPPTTL